jgi:DNA-binding SARP family transcriptional activator
MLELTVLGPPFAALNGERFSAQRLRSRRLALLAYLALEGAQSRARLGALLFGDVEPEEARARLRLELHRAAQSPLGAHLRADGELVAVCDVTCDALEFEGHLSAGRWSEVLNLARGALLEGLDVADAPELEAWINERRDHFARGHVRALEGRIAELERLGDAAGALEMTREWLRMQPFSEAACDALTRRLEALGRRGEALGEREAFSERFQRELGVEPTLAHDLGARGARLEAIPEPARPSLRDPPLVGREGVWAQLTEWRDGSSPQAALLVGESGVGKSRLASAFAATIGGTVLTLRGLESAQERPFEAVLEALRRAGRAGMATLEPAASATLGAVLPEVFGGFAVTTVSSESRLLDTLSRALRAVLHRADALVLEDLHWLDAASVRVLEYTEARLRDSGTVPRIIATARPGALRANVALSRWLADLERAGRLQRLEVAPLSEVAVLRLLRLLSGSPRATAFAQRLYALSGGNPYALLAFLGGLVSRGALETGDPSGWRLRVPLEDLTHELPATLREVLLHTVEALGADTLRLLETAALRGDPFEFSSVRAGSELNEVAVKNALTRALEHRLALPVEGETYRLEHDLLRVALSANLSHERARATHLRLARHLDSLEAAPAERARHWQAGGARDAARPLWLEAAQAAAGLWAHREALQAYGHALECTDDVLERLEIHAERCLHHKSLHDLGAWRAEIEAADALIATHLELEIAQREGLRFARQRVHLLWRSQDLSAALEHSLNWTGGELTFERAALLHDQAMILLDLQQPEAAATVLENVLKRISEGQETVIANFHNALAQVALEQGKIDIALEHSYNAIAGFEQINRRDGLASALGNQAAIFDRAGNQSARRLSLERALRVAEQSGNRHLLRGCLFEICQLARDSQDWDAGIRHATYGAELCEEDADTTNAQSFANLIEGFRKERKANATPLQRPAA